MDAIVYFSSGLGVLVGGGTVAVMVGKTSGVRVAAWGWKGVMVAGADVGAFTGITVSLWAGAQAVMRRSRKSDRCLMRINLL